MSKSRKLHQIHAGEITLGDSTLTCAVRSLSSSGARVDVASANELPQEFDLSIAQLQAKHYCAVVAREVAYVRVVFV